MPVVFSTVRVSCLALAAWLLAPLMLSACQHRTACEKTCLRVARCRKQARDGAPILGERELPPDARCMKRCAAEHELFAKCEAKQRTCAALRRCYGPLR